ncbi:MAG: ATP-binding cassette domain-containing protein [Pacificimonas sp.]|nr:ATP-binding cassette domain-containing protein [Pacificimonas sp.]
MAGDIAVEARGLKKSFGDKLAVHDIDLTAREGEILGFLGQNGAGKTTTIRMLLGILSPDEGRCEVLGSTDPLSIAHRIGYLPEERGLYPAMSTRETIAFMGALRGLPLSEGRRRAETLLEANGLGAEIDAKIRTMSKGMAQKVQLLGSFVHEPDLIILDEPFSGLDPVNQQALEAMIEAERQRGATIVFSTHIMGHAERLCDRLVVVAGGRTRFTGTVTEARSVLPAVVALTTERAIPPNLLPDGAHQVPSGEWRFPVPDMGVEALLRRIIDSGAGLRDFTTERPTLHDAFVEMVGDPEADDAALAEERQDAADAADPGAERAAA